MCAVLSKDSHSLSLPRLSPSSVRRTIRERSTAKPLYLHEPPSFGHIQSCATYICHTCTCKERIPTYALTCLQFTSYHAHTSAAINTYAYIQVDRYLETAPVGSKKKLKPQSGSLHWTSRPSSNVPTLLSGHGPPLSERMAAFTMMM